MIKSNSSHLAKTNGGGEISRRNFLCLSGTAVGISILAACATPSLALGDGAGIRQREQAETMPDGIARGRDGLALFDPHRGSHLPMLTDQRQHFHEAFGLVFATPFPSPEMLPAHAAEPDVTVSYGPVDAVTKPSYNGPWDQIQFVDGDILYNRTGVARAAVRDGSSITLQRMPWVPDDEVRYAFLSIVMTALLPQRGILSLHASAVSAATTPDRGRQLSALADFVESELLRA